MLKRIFFFFVDTIQAIVFAASVFILLYLFVAQPNQVNGRSMMPNFEDKEMLLTDKISYRFHSPERGDVVVFKAPPSEVCAEDECEYIKRVIGLPGDRAMVKESHIYINGQLVIEPHIPPENVTEPGSFLSEGIEKVIPEGQYLLMGDNRPHSRDGREFGPVDATAIVGRAFFVYWPTSQAGLVENITYPDY